MKITSFVLLILGVVAPQLSSAATLTWDIAPGVVGPGNGTITGGAGAWNNTGLNGVWTSDGGVNNVAWVNNATTPDSAVFGGAAAGTVTVTTVNVQDITFNTTAGYILNTGTITLGDTAVGDQSDPTITANVNATIQSTLAGNDGLVKNGSGTLTFNAANTFTGGLTVNAGTVAFNGSQVGNRLAANSLVTINSGATVDIINTNPLPSGANSIDFEITGGTLTSTAGNHSHVRNVTLNSGALWTHSGAGQSGGERFLLQGNVTVGGTSASTISGNQGIGLNGTRTFNVADVTGNANSDLIVNTDFDGPDASAGGGVLKTGAGTLEFTVANAYSLGTTVNAGTIFANAGNTASGALGGGNITVNNGGTIRVGGDNSFVGYTTSGSRTITINSGGLITNTGSSTNHLNALVLNGGTLSATTANSQYGNWTIDFGVSTSGNGTTSTISGGNATITQSGGTIFNIGNNDTLNVSTILADATSITETNLIKSGAGTMVLTGANTYATNTLVNAGKLLVSNTTSTQSGVGTGNLIINGGTLGGTGYLGLASNATNVTFGANGGTIAPGASPGILTIRGGIDFTTTGTASFAVELNGLTVGTGYDQLVLTTATGGTNQINLANATLLVSLGFTPTVGNQFTILDNQIASGGLTGIFNGLSNNSLFTVDNVIFQINYNGGTGNDVVLTVFEIVPEPSSFALLLCGCAMACLARRKRSRANVFQPSNN